MSHEIENGIPIPNKKPGRPPKWPLEAMEVGDSFAVRADKVRDVQSKLVWTIHYLRKTRGWDRKYVTRTVKENGRKMVRCWRVA